MFARSWRATLFPRAENNAWELASLGGGYGQAAGWEFRDYWEPKAIMAYKKTIMAYKRTIMAYKKNIMAYKNHHLILLTQDHGS